MAIQEGESDILENKNSSDEDTIRNQNKNQIKKNSIIGLICIIVWIAIYIVCSIYIVRAMQDAKHDCEQRNQEYDKHTCKFFNQTLSYNEKIIDITYEVTLLDFITNMTFMYQTQCIITKKCNGLALDGARECFVKKNNHILIKWTPDNCPGGSWEIGVQLWFFMTSLIHVITLSTIALQWLKNLFMNE